MVGGWVRMSWTFTSVRRRAHRQERARQCPTPFGTITLGEIGKPDKQTEKGLTRGNLVALPSTLPSGDGISGQLTRTLGVASTFSAPTVALRQIVARRNSCIPSSGDI